MFWGEGASAFWARSVESAPTWPPLTSQVLRANSTFHLKDSSKLPCPWKGSPVGLRASGMWQMEALPQPLISTQAGDKGGSVRGKGGGMSSQLRILGGTSFNSGKNCSHSKGASPCAQGLSSQLFRCPERSNPDLNIFEVGKPAQ